MNEDHKPFRMRDAIGIVLGVALIFILITWTTEASHEVDPIIDLALTFYQDAGSIPTDDIDKHEKTVMLLDELLIDLKAIDIEACQMQTWARVYASFWMAREFFLTGEYTDIQALGLSQLGSAIVGTVQQPRCEHGDISGYQSRSTESGHLRPTPR